MAEPQNLKRPDLHAKASETLANLGNASIAVGGVIKETITGAGDRTVSGIRNAAIAGAKASERVAVNTASIGLSATDGLAGLARRNKEVAAVAVVIAAAAGAWAWMRSVGKKDARVESRAAEVDDLQGRLASLKAARGETSALAGANNPNNAGHVAATGRGVGR